MMQIKIDYKYEVVLLLVKKESHGRELAKELKTSLTRVQSVLNELRELNVVDYKVEGKNHVYFIKKNLVSKYFLLNAENYKLVKIVSKHSLLEPVFQDILDKCKAKLIILFGSYSNEKANNESDIDIYIDTINSEIKKDVEKINSLISVKIGNFNKDEILIKEIIKNHVILRGVEEYYEKIEFFK